MKRAKVLISSTTNQEMDYKIYRFKDEKPSTNLSDYVNIDPIGSISERKASIEQTIENKYEPFVIDNGDNYKYKTFSLPFEFIYKSDFFIFNIGTNVDEEPILRVIVYTGKTSLMEIIIRKYSNGTSSVVYQTSNQEEMAKILVIENNSTVSLSKEITKDYKVITLALQTRKIGFIDNNSNGVYKHKYTLVEKINDYEIHPIIKTQENIYYYSVVGTHIDGRLSDISNISPIVIAENPNDITTIVEVSDDYCINQNNPTWVELENIKASTVYRIKKDNMYSREIPKFNINEIKIDDSNLQVYSERLIQMPNLWHNDKISYRYRLNRAYRFTNELFGEKAEVSDVFYEEGYSNINIDKIVVYKKNVTQLDYDKRQEPIQITDNTAKLLKIYIRTGGIYYQDAILKADYEPIELVSNNSRYPILQIKDNCLYSSVYNYTVYLYDEKGKQSIPYTVVK